MNSPLIVIGCGILHKEVNFLIAKNDWNVKTRFLASALHNNLQRLSDELSTALDICNHERQQCAVFYGSCHPCMDDILAKHHTFRTEGQNCIAMLLGYEQFMVHLEQGAYFLLEDWALSWEPMITEAFGNNRSVVREIFRGSHKHMIALRTPCSDDFTEAAETAASFVDLPLQWMDVSLDHLELVLANAIALRRDTGA